MALFSAFSIGLFSLALTRDGYWRLPILASLPVYWNVISGQVVTLATAAMILPALWWLWPVKYTIGATGVAAKLSPRYIAFGLSFVLLTIVIWPWWPPEWLAELRDNNGTYYRIPALVPGGFVLLLALLRWRRPEARLFAAMACVPQAMLFYDQLPLSLVAQSYRQALLMSVCSWAAPLVAIVIYGSAAVDLRLLMARNALPIVCCYYLPLLIMILTRPNRGAVPAFLEKASGNLPAWLKGSTE
jgi:hypothetical protein